MALCSAVFAGFAYVGYAVVRQVFGGKKLNNGFFRDENDCLGLEYETEPRGKVYLRRLSGSRHGIRFFTTSSIYLTQTKTIIIVLKENSQSVIMTDRM